MTDSPKAQQVITNDEKVEVNQTVNKKLAEMSKEAKKGRAKRKLQKPPKDDESATLTTNQIYMLLAIVGVIIAGASLYYQRKSFERNEKNDETPEDAPTPVVVDRPKRSPGPSSEPNSPQAPGMYSF